MDYIALDAATAPNSSRSSSTSPETLDRVNEHDGLAPVMGDLHPYRVSDLHADVARLIERLQRSQLTP
jgi:hypothetical protein